MNLTDATLALLAAKIHGNDGAIRKTAKSVVKQLPRSKRDLIYKIIESRRPLDLVVHLGANLDSQPRGAAPSLLSTKTVRKPVHNPLKAKQCAAASACLFSEL